MDSVLSVIKLNKKFDGTIALASVLHGKLAKLIGAHRLLGKQYGADADAELFQPDEMHAYRVALSNANLEVDRALYAIKKASAVLQDAEHAQPRALHVAEAGQPPP